MQQQRALHEQVIAAHCEEACTTVAGEYLEVV
jgi:hypothetical protein